MELFAFAGKNSQQMSVGQSQIFQNSGEPPKRNLQLFSVELKSLYNAGI